MREHITVGATPFRKAYIQALVDRVEVDDGVVRIIGDKATLEQAIAGQAVAGQAVAAAGVRRCTEVARARNDSNVRLSD
jgi:site-specific DNA recombinase